MAELRRRLEALPDGHPSADAPAEAADPGSDVRERPGVSADDPLADDPLADDRPADDPPAAESLAEDPRAGDPGSGLRLPPGPLAGRGGYRPWFADGVSEPWFAAELRADQDG